MHGGFGFGCPNEQPADRMPPVEGIEEPFDLVAIPDVTSLKFGQGHVAAVDMIEYG